MKEFTKPINTIVFKPGRTGIYVHFPYCQTKCSYCDFYSATQTPKLDVLFQQYKKEFVYRLDTDKTLQSQPVETLFIGGGTPSLAPAEYYHDLISFMKQHLEFMHDAEITLEANPENLDTATILSLHQAGINRLSVGVQSFQPELLTTLGRCYSKEKYDQLLTILDNGPIQNFNIDLIYGIPGQTMESFTADLAHALSSKVSHLSIYSLTVEKNTLYDREIKTGFAIAPNEELQIAILKMLPSYLLEKGFHQYEVSNFCKPRFRSRHNMKYWTMEYYLSIGPGAHGYTPSGRYANKRSLSTYLDGEFSSSYEPSEYYTELALGLFRIFYPIEISSFLLDQDRMLRLETVLEKFKKEELCTYENGIFRWRPESVFRLDELVYIIAEAIH